VIAVLGQYRRHANIISASTMSDGHSDTPLPLKSLLTATEIVLRFKNNGPAVSTDLFFLLFTRTYLLMDWESAATAFCWEGLLPGLSVKRPHLLGLQIQVGRRPFTHLMSDA